VVKQAANLPNGAICGGKSILGRLGVASTYRYGQFLQKNQRFLKIFKNFKFAQNSPKWPIRAQNRFQKPDRSIRGVMTLIRHLFFSF
jgi:hypothetical protein